MTMMIGELTAGSGAGAADLVKDSDTKRFVADVIEALAQAAGDRRLLGALVWSLQATGAGAREGRAPGQWKGPHGQDQRRREPAARRPDACAVDPRSLRLRQRPTGRRASWARCPRAS